MVLSTLHQKTNGLSECQPHWISGPTVTKRILSCCNEWCRKKIANISVRSQRPSGYRAGKPRPSAELDPQQPRKARPQRGWSE